MNAQRHPARAAITAVAAMAAFLVGCGTPPAHSTLGSLSVSAPTTVVSSADAAQLAKGTWTALPEAPITPRQGASVVWDGRELLVWGGQSGPDGDTLYADGAAFNPATGTWRLLPPGPLSARVGQAAVWTGHEMVVWGGYDDMSNGTGRVTASGAAYDPATDAWRALPASPLNARANALAVWTGRDVLILGGQPAAEQNGAGGYTDGALLDPATDRWTPLAPPARFDGHTISWRVAVPASGEVLAWSEWTESHQAAPGEFELSGGVDLFSYTEADGTWRRIPTSPPALPDAQDAFWTGAAVYVRGSTYNCGVCPGPFVPEATAVFNPTSGDWVRLPADPLGGDNLLSVWTGAALFSFDASGEYGSILPGAASVYDPNANAWTRAPGAPFGCDASTDPIWTGQQILQYCPRSSTSPAAIHDGLAYTPRPAPTGS